MDRALGIDVSVWDDDNSTPQKVDFNKSVKNGASFVFIKASQRYADEDFIWNWKAAKDAGLLRGAFHFLDWRMNEIDQAKLFVGLLGNDPGELPPILDLEMEPGPYGLSFSIVQGKVWNFMTYVEKALGRIPGIYTGYYYWVEKMNNNSAWARYPFWLAWWASESIIKVPPPWKSWTFWQYSGKGDGLAYGCESKEVDLNLFNGSLDDLKKYAGLSVPTIPQPVPWSKSITSWARSLGYAGPDPEV
jgi:lysozyme